MPFLEYKASRIQNNIVSTNICRAGIVSSKEPKIRQESKNSPPLKTLVNSMKKIIFSRKLGIFQFTKH